MGPINWYGFIKKYVWDDTRTPYFVSVGKLSKTQAGYELFTFAVLLAMFFLVVGMAALFGRAFHGQSLGLAFYAFTVTCGAITLAATRHYYAALYCSTAPPAALFYFLFYGFPPSLHRVDELLLLAITLILLRYTFRLVAIAKAYPDMPGDPPDG